MKLFLRIARWFTKMYLYHLILSKDSMQFTDEEVAAMEKTLAIVNGLSALLDEKTA